MGMAPCLSCLIDKWAIKWGNIGSRRLDLTMATVNWPEPKSFFSNEKQVGFDFRNILTEKLAFEGDRKYVVSEETLTIVGAEPPPTNQKSKLEIFRSSYEDTYSGTFIVGEEGERTTVKTGPFTTKSTFVGYQWIESGTITGITRNANLDNIGTITGIELDYREAADAGSTQDKADDMALWAKAFAGNDVFSGSPVTDWLEGFAGNDTMAGQAGNDRLDGGLGPDYLAGGIGNDTILGSGGDDKLIGNQGADRLFGEADKDTFVLTSIKDSTVKSVGRDIIYDFASSQKDRIDLGGIDANIKVQGNQAFKYIGSPDFHKKAGELRWEKVTGGVAVLW
jgi:Ca2+-binding RTX toxin-like protein